MNGSSKVTKTHQTQHATQTPALLRNKLKSRNKNGSTSVVTNLLQQFSEGVIYDFQRILEHLLSLQQREQVQIIGITAAHSYEGASTITAGLSLLAAARQVTYVNGSMPRLGNKTLPQGPVHSPNILLLDTHFKHPSQHFLLNTTREPGLIDYLESKILWDDSLKSIPNSRLSLIPAGRETQQTFYNLYLDALYSLLERVRDEFSFIFLDIPPLLEYAEGITLSKLCDGIILTIKSAQTRWEAVQEANGLLDKANVHVLGAILNDRRSYIPQWLSRYL